MSSIEQSAMNLARAELAAENARAAANEAAERAASIQARAAAARAEIERIRAGRSTTDLSDAEAGRAFLLDRDARDLDALHAHAAVEAEQLCASAEAAEHDVGIARVALERAQALAEFAEVHAHARAAEDALNRAIGRLWNLRQRTGNRPRVLSDVFQFSAETQRMHTYGVPPAEAD